MIIYRQAMRKLFSVRLHTQQSFQTTIVAFAGRYGPRALLGAGGRCSVMIIILLNVILSVSTRYYAFVSATFWQRDGRTATRPVHM
jgi:hypothetical protein